MPIGVLINTVAIFLGGIAGALLGDKLPEKYKEQLNMIFGLCSMGMGIASIGLMKYIPAVIFAIIIQVLRPITNNFLILEIWSIELVKKCKNLW